MAEEKITYTLVMEKETAHTVLDAVELFMRLKLKQEDQIPYKLLMYKMIGTGEYCKRRDEAMPLLKEAFDIMFPTLDDWKKDREWYILYNTYQALRYQIHEAEHPWTVGVDSDPPRQLGSDEPIPKCTFTKEKED